MTLFVDKYRPTELSKLSYHLELSKKLEHIVQAGDFPHLLFCGPSGAGKRTRIHCLLRKLYGKGASNVRTDSHNFTTLSNKKLQINVVNSNYHIELTPSDVGMYDRIVVQEVIKEMAGMQQINSAIQKPFKAQNLSKDAQHALRNTMEKYASTCKLILCCESSSSIIDPLRSRCMTIRVPAPSVIEIKECINFVCNNEKLTVSPTFINKLTKKSDGNLRRALLLLEATAAQFGKNLDNHEIVQPEWETYLHETAKIIKEKQNSNGLFLILIIIICLD